MKLTYAAALICLSCLAPLARAAPKVPKLKPINCGTSDFSALDKCCETPVGDLAASEFVKECNPTNDAKLKFWINDYYLNKLQIASKGNTVDITDRGVVKTLCKVAPFINCLFDKAGLYGEGETVDPQKVLDYIKSSRNADDEWTKKLEDHITSVGDFKDYIPPQFENGVSCTDPANKKAKVNVKLAPLVLVQFLQFGIVDMCPQYKNDVKCNQTLASWNRCNTPLWTKMYPEGSVVRVQQLGAQSDAGGKKNIKDYINSRRQAKGKAPLA